MNNTQKLFDLARNAAEKAYCPYSKFAVGAAILADDNNFYAKTFSSWWDGYKGEEAVLVDEIFSEKKNEMLYYLKLWGDKLTVKQPIKGSFVNLVYKKIALTANFWPWELEMNSIEKKEFLDPILRRYKFIKLINYV